MKTRGGWTYTTVEPGVHLWRSPYGYSYRRDHRHPRRTTDPSACRDRLIRAHRDDEADPEAGHSPDR